MRRSDLLRPTFRLKLLVAFVGTIAPLLLITLLVVRREADRQIDAIVESTSNRARDAFAQIEGIRQQQLNQLGERFANSNRWGAAMQQAMEGDIPFFVEQTGYELQFAGVPHALVAVADLSGEPVVAALNGAALPDASVAVSTKAIDRIFAGDTAVFGYQLIGTRLFSIHPIVVSLATYPIGILFLGFAIDNETARSLAHALGADVCFRANEECVASSGQLFKARQFANVTQPLPGAAGMGSVIALRIPLDEAVRPFAKIQRSIRLIGVAVLLLAIIIAVVLSRGLAQPVRALVGATARVARGEYDTHVPVETRDELGMLAAAFNEMTTGLLLKEKYRGVLDKVVSRDVADEMLKGEITLGGETRTVTTLFADIRGFTPMSEEMAAHEVVSLLNDVMERLEAVVVAEGGVVDKYVGDEIMALFGAPVARGDDALRAVRAAVRMQEELESINSIRADAGKAPVTLGIGINTGDVVAGNMGSARRLNYTVLGMPVNLAARLCSMAAPGQILVSRETLRLAGNNVEYSELGRQTVKGIAQPVEIFQVEHLVHEPLVPASRIAALAIAVLLLAAPGARAQRAVTVGPLQITPSARIDAVGFETDQDPAYLIADTNAFAAPRISLFTDVFAGEHWYGFAEFRLDRGEVPSSGNLQARIEQAFLRWSPFTDADISLQAGRFVSPFGAYPQRHHSSADPLIRPPLAYDYRTMVSTWLVPMSNDGFIGWKDKPAFFRPKGAPPVWNAPYQLGLMLLGSASKFSFRFAAMNGAPSTEPDVWNSIPDGAADLSYVANLSMQVSPELRIGASFDKGGYLDPDSVEALPPGEPLSHYKQTLVGVDVTFTRGLLELRGELIHDTWDVPRVHEYPVDISFFGEARLKLSPGLWAAARYNEIRFNEIAYDSGATAPWDYDTRRVQLGGGYRITESLDVRGEWMLNQSDGPRDPSDNLLSIQASWSVN